MPKFPGRGPKDWSPNRIEKIMEGLEDLTVDTSFISERVQLKLLPFVTMNPGHTLSGFHLTENPEAVARAIKRGDLREDESRPSERVGGIFVNDNPEMTWQVSPDRWKPLKRMDPEDREYLESIIMLKLYGLKERGQIVDQEYDTARRAVEGWREYGDTELLMRISWVGNYGIDIPAIAEQNLPINPWRPYAVPVVFKGRYFRFTDEASLQSRVLAAYHLKKPEKDVTDADVGWVWQRLGWDGMILPASYELRVPGLLLWNPEKILSYGTREESRFVGGST